ncbi:MAG: hypothetical protein K2L45_03335 [Muribaculaceae bacterium]|nr:hypothetical protein [Muribaculaceae bacterium]
MKHLKQEFDKLTFKEVALHTIGFLTLVAAFVLLFLGMFIPPEGEIHDSVLTAFGLSLLFVAAVYGISAYFVSSLKGFKAAVLDLLTKHDVDIDKLTKETTVNLDN